jgi:hypothetical protein
MLHLYLTFKIFLKLILKLARTVNCKDSNHELIWSILLEYALEESFIPSVCTMVAKGKSFSDN